MHVSVRQYLIHIIPKTRLPEWLYDRITTAAIRGASVLSVAVALADEMLQFGGETREIHGVLERGELRYCLS